MHWSPCLLAAQAERRLLAEEEFISSPGRFYVGSTLLGVESNVASAADCAARCSAGDCLFWSWCPDNGGG